MRESNNFPYTKNVKLSNILAYTFEILLGRWKVQMGLSSIRTSPTV